MTRLLRSLTRIAMLREDPGALPASAVLAVLLGIAYAGASALHAFVNGDDHIVARAGLDLGLTLAFFWLLLALTSRGHRFVQTMSAVFGAYVLLAPLVTLLLLARGVAKSSDPALLLTSTGSALVIVWFLLIVAHILKHALDTGLITGCAIAVTWVLASWTLAARLFPGAT
jgi:hypothetical protein